MFKEEIRSTTLTSSIAETYYNDRIKGGIYGYDVSFNATLKALVFDRMDDDETITVSFNTSSYSHSVLSTTAEATILGVVGRPENVRQGQIRVHGLNSSNHDDNEAWFEYFNSRLPKYNGWVRLEKITEFFRKSFCVTCFINVEMRSVILLVENLDLRKIHYLQCSTLAFLPWYFDKDTGINEKEMELIRSLREKTPDKYIKCIESFAQDKNFRDLVIRTKLHGFETRFEKAELERVRGEICRTNTSIKEYSSRIAECLRERRGFEITLLGLEEKVREGSTDENSEIMQYFLCNKRLYLEDVNDENIVFCVKDYIQFFEEDMAERVINKGSSYVYDVSPRLKQNISDSSMKKLMTAIFVDQTIKLRICAAYRFRIAGRVSGINHDYGPEFDDSMPNPHIDEYQCLGTYEQLINECLARNDYISAIEQCCASAKSLNFGDSTVMSTFMNEMYGSQTKFLELPDGTSVSPKEAVMWLEEKEKSNE